MAIRMFLLLITTIIVCQLLIFSILTLLLIANRQIRIPTFFNMIKSRLADIFRYLSTLRLLAANYNYKMTNMKKGLACLWNYKSPCGLMVLASVDDELCLCDWNDMPCSERNMRRVMRMMRVEFTRRSSDVIQRAMGQLYEYFTGSRMTFDIPLHLCGTEFQKRVWLSLPYIPYGETRSYKDIAVGIGQPNAVRAVAQAIGANAISILVPCHRVIGCNHTLTGYAGGLDAKKKLLELERREPFTQPYL